MTENRLGLAAAEDCSNAYNLDFFSNVYFPSVVEIFWYVHITQASFQCHLLILLAKKLIVNFLIMNICDD